MNCCQLGLQAQGNLCLIVAHLWADLQYGSDVIKGQPEYEKMLVDIYTA